MLKYDTSIDRVSDSLDRRGTIVNDNDNSAGTNIIRLRATESVIRPDGPQSGRNRAHHFAS